MCITPTLIIRTYVHFIRRNKHRTQKTSFFAPPRPSPGAPKIPKKVPKGSVWGVFSPLFDQKNPSCRNHLFCPAKVQKGCPKTSFWAFRCNSIVTFFLTTNQQREAQKRVLGHLFLTFAGGNKCFLNGAKINCHFLQPVYSVCRSQTKKNESNWILLLGIYSEFRLFIFAGVLQCFFDAQENTIKKQ